MNQATNLLNLQLTVTASYVPNGVSPEVLLAKLYEAGEHGIINGMLTGSTEAELEGYSLHAVEVPAGTKTITDLRREFIASITAATSLGENGVHGLADMLLSHLPVVVVAPAQTESVELLSSDLLATFMLDRIENGQLHLEDIPVRLARYGLMDPAAFCAEMRERMEEVEFKGLPEQSTEPASSQTADVVEKPGDTLVDNVRYLLDNCPHTVRDMSGQRTGTRGQEDLVGSLSITFLGMQTRLAQARNRPVKPDTLLPTIVLRNEGKNPHGYSAEVARSGDKGIYDEVRVGIHQDDKCVADVLIGLTPAGEPRVMVTTGGNGDDGQQIAVFPLREIDAACSTDEQ